MPGQRQSTNVRNSHDDICNTNSRIWKTFLDARRWSANFGSIGLLTGHYLLALSPMTLDLRDRCVPIGVTFWGWRLFANLCANTFNFTQHSVSCDIPMALAISFLDLPPRGSGPNSHVRGHYQRRRLID